MYFAEVVLFYPTGSNSAGDEKNNHSRLFEIEQLARQKGVVVQKAAKEKLVNIAGVDKTQGVVAYLLEQEFLSVEDILQVSQKLNEPPLLAMLDGIEDPHNLGVILRSADGAGLHGVILPKRRTSAITPVVAKSSAGAYETLKLRKFYLTHMHKIAILCI